MFLHVLSIIADIVGIIGCVFSVIVFLRTGSIKKTVEKNYTAQRNLTAFEKIRQQSMQELSECCSYLAECTEDVKVFDVMPYLERIDRVIVDVERYHPSLTENDKKAIERIKKYISNKNRARTFSYLNIIQDLHDIISMLRVEAMYYD